MSTGASASEIARSAGGKLRGLGSSSKASITTSKQIRQVRLVATPRVETASPVIYELQSEGGDSWIYADNYRVNVVSLNKKMATWQIQHFPGIIDGLPGAM